MNNLHADAVTAYLGLGSNIGDRAAHLQEAILRLGGRSGITVTAVSPVYETAPVGPISQPRFFNAACEIRTIRDPLDILAVCLDIETELGRERKIAWGPRIIDIDLLLYGSRVINDDRLIVPHPRMIDRGFVLVPLADIAATVRHPLDGRTIGEIAAQADRSGMNHRTDIVLHG